MPLIGGMSLSYLFAIIFTIHAVRTRQETYWIYLMFMLPGIGVLLYGFTVFLPAMRYTRSGFKMERKFKKMINPNRELSEAQLAFDTAATVENRKRLADALLAKGDAQSALQHYQQLLSGLYENDPDMMFHCASAKFASGDASGARQLLDALRAANPTYNSQEAHLLYARALAGEGLQEQARTEFAALCRYYAGFDARAYFAETLCSWGEYRAAQEILDPLFAEIQRVPRHVRELNQEAIARAKKCQAALASNLHP